VRRLHAHVSSDGILAGSASVISEMNEKGRFSMEREILSYSEIGTLQNAARKTRDFRDTASLKIDDVSERSSNYCSQHIHILDACDSIKRTFRVLLSDLTSHLVTLASR
jgi:hypothetical protein